MRRALVVLIACLIATQTLVGCATVKKKFKRKRKEEVIRPVVFSGHEDVREYSNKYYYQTHFTHWRTWHGEILNYLGGNAKKLRRAFEESIGHLNEMRRYLQEPKKTELSVEIDKLREIRDRIASRGMRMADTSIRIKIERSLRVITAGFYYDKVVDFVEPDTLDLTATQP